MTILCIFYIFYHYTNKWRPLSPALHITRCRLAPYGLKLGERHWAKPHNSFSKKKLLHTPLKPSRKLRKSPIGLYGHSPAMVGPGVWRRWSGRLQIGRRRIRLPLGNKRERERIPRQVRKGCLWKKKPAPANRKSNSYEEKTGAWFQNVESPEPKVPVQGLRFQRVLESRCQKLQRVLSRTWARAGY